MHLDTRRFFTAVTAHPNGDWVAQQARNVGAVHPDIEIRFVIHDRDAKFTSAFDAIFSSAGAEVIKTPIRSPKASAFAERVVRTVRTEVPRLDADLRTATSGGGAAWVCRPLQRGPPIIVSSYVRLRIECLQTVRSPFASAVAIGSAASSASTIRGRPNESE